VWRFKYLFKRAISFVEFNTGLWRIRNYIYTVKCKRGNHGLVAGVLLTDDYLSPVDHYYCMHCHKEWSVEEWEGRNV